MTALDELARLDRVAIVLFEPQDDINIGNVVRAAKNFGVDDIRLVRPASADPHRIGISAPRAQGLINTIQKYDSLEEALAECVYVVGTTARSRKGAWVVDEPRTMAKNVVARSEAGKVAIVFGREDSGLPNDALDLCHAVASVPTRPEYSSLNLGQAVLLMIWEVYRVENEFADDPKVTVSALTEFPPASSRGIELMLGEAERALSAVEFFKSDGAEHVMRSIRSVLTRAQLDERELEIWFGVFNEIPGFLKRKFDYEPDPKD